jgi:hypothetical protein
MLIRKVFHPIVTYNWCMLMHFDDIIYSVLSVMWGTLSFRVGQNIKSQKCTSFLRILHWVCNELWRHMLSSKNSTHWKETAIKGQYLLKGKNDWLILRRTDSKSLDSLVLPNTWPKPTVTNCEIVKSVQTFTDSNFGENFGCNTWQHCSKTIWRQLYHFLFPVEWFYQHY